MSCGKNHDVKKKDKDDDLKKRQEWEKKNPDCSPSVDKNCPHPHIPEK